MTTNDPRTILDEIKARAEKLDRGLPCAWCGIASMGLARHNDGLLNPSCGEDGHGFEWRSAVSPQTVAGALTSYPDMAAALVAVLDVIDRDAWDQQTDEVGMVPVVNTEDIRAAIADALGGDRG